MRFAKKKYSLTSTRNQTNAKLSGFIMTKEQERDETATPSQWAMAMPKRANNKNFSIIIYFPSNGAISSVRLKGLEPPRLSSPDPKSGAATNYATAAKWIAKIQFIFI